MKTKLSKKNIQGSWRGTILSHTSSIQDAIQILNAVCLKIVLIIDDSNKLIGTVSDGDIRRGLLRGLSMSSSIRNIIHRNALVVPPDMKREMVMQLMAANKIHQIPVVDKNQHVVGLHLWDKITLPTRRPNFIIIMAGGIGSRLRPHTEKCPKPMLHIAGKPMLEHIIIRAKKDGFYKFFIAIHYLGEKIEEYFGQGNNLNVEINYLREKKPLGTAGALNLLNPMPDIPFIVTNGDVVTDIRYGELIDFHSKHEADATMAVRVHEWQNPFGVVKTKGVKIVDFQEKPIIRSHINAGVYALSPSALKSLNKEKAFDMPNLFERLRIQSKKTIAYPIHESWMDIGRFQDYQKATESAIR